MIETKYIINLFDKSNLVFIGRQNDGFDFENKSINAIILPQDKYATRITKTGAHAFLTKNSEGKIFIEDKNSTNGTLLNNKQIKGQGKKEFDKGDSLLIGNTMFKRGIINENEQKFDAIEIEHYIPDSEILSIKDVIKKDSNSKNAKVILQHISFSLKSNEFTLIMGGSGSGKSTLLKCLCGEAPPEHGLIRFKGQKLYENWGILKKHIGYVKQYDNLHEKLSVFEELSLAYSIFKSQVPKNKAEISVIVNKVENVLFELEISDIKNKQIKNLSGGQRKRVAIAIELLKEPNILFLDEPTSPLDPASIRDLMSCLKNIQKRRELSILMVSHKPDDIEYADKIIFLGASGFHVFWGTKRQLFEKFQINSIADLYPKVKNYDDAKKYHLSEKKDFLDNIEDKSKLKTKSKGYSAISQYLMLSYRYLLNKIKDSKNLLLLLLQAIGIPIVLCLANDNYNIGLLFWIVISAVWFGVSNSAREIVSEIDLFRKERLYNLRLLPYILSKITILSLFSLAQVSIFLLIIFFWYQNTSDSTTPQVSSYWLYLFIVFMITFISILLGLALSSIGKTTERVMTLLPILLIPQIIFSNFTTQANSFTTEIISSAMIGRWGMELLSRIQNREKDFNIAYYNEKTNSIDTFIQSIETTVTEMKDLGFECDTCDFPPKNLISRNIRINPVLFLIPPIEQSDENKIFLGKTSQKRIYHRLYSDNWYSIKGNILFLLFNGFFYFFITFISLKSKDTVKNGRIKIL